MVTVEFEATTDMPDDEYPLVKISYLFFTTPDESESLMIRMYDAYADGGISSGKLYMRADGCTVLTENGMDSLPDDEALSKLRSCRFDVEVEFSGKYMEKDVSGYSLLNPRIVVSSSDASNYLFTSIEPMERYQYGFLHEESIDALEQPDNSVMAVVNTIKPL